MPRIPRIPTTLAMLAALLALSFSKPLGAAVIDNITGLPAYPGLRTAAMEPRWKTESFGRWCARFSGETSDPLSTVAAWYRQHLTHISETVLAGDDQFVRYAPTAGIKLSVQTDYVALYRTADLRTIIELHRCSAPGGST